MAFSTSARPSAWTSRTSRLFSLRASVSAARPDGLGGGPGLLEALLDAAQVALVGLQGLVGRRLVLGDPGRPLVEDAQDGLEEDPGQDQHEDPDDGEDDQSRCVDLSIKRLSQGEK